MKKFNTNADLDYACRQLAAQDARLAHVYETYGPAHAPGTDGFAGLVRILIAQQVSTAAATTIQAAWMLATRHDAASMVGGR